MAPDKLVVSNEEIDEVKVAATTASSPVEKLRSPIPVWARCALSILVLVLPLLCIVALIFKIAFRNQPPRVKYAWASFLALLLAMSGIFSTVGAVLVFSFVPIPAVVSTGLSDLDERDHFPLLPSVAALTGTEASEKLKPLVIVVSPPRRLWNRQEVSSGYLGAGVLLFADKDGYLFATARHLVGSREVGSGAATHAMIATASGIWATADVIGVADRLDMALLWMPRHSGNVDFAQSVGSVTDGEEIFVIGHPEGLKYTLSTGVISGLRNESIQISAPVSPGNSGGPVYDTHGALIGIVSAKFDKNADANAENLGFAAKAEALSQESNWTFQGNGRQHLESYLAALKRLHLSPPTGN